MQPLTSGPWRKERRRAWITESKQASRTGRAIIMSQQIQVTRRPRPAPAPEPDAPTTDARIARTWFT
jgi:hypothetical protein